MALRGYGVIIVLILESLTSAGLSRVLSESSRHEKGLDTP